MANTTHLLWYYRNDYIASAAYAQSKLAQLISTVHMSRLFTENNIPVNVYGVHPGIVDTELFDGTAFKKIFPWFPRLLFKVCLLFKMKVTEFHI